MKTHLLSLVLLAAALPASLGADTPPLATVRERFVPQRPGEPRRCASWSQLWKAPMVKAGELFA